MAEEPSQNGLVPEVVPPAKSELVQIWHWSVGQKTARIVRVSAAISFLGLAGWLLQNFLQLRGVVDLIASRIDLGFLWLALTVAGCAATLGLRKQKAVWSAVAAVSMLVVLGLDWWAPRPKTKQSIDPYLITPDVASGMLMTLSMAHDCEIAILVHDSGPEATMLAQNLDTMFVAVRWKKVMPDGILYGKSREKGVEVAAATKSDQCFMALQAALTVMGQKTIFRANSALPPKTLQVTILKPNYP